MEQRLLHQRGRFESYALLNRKPMEIFKIVFNLGGMLMLISCDA